MSRRRQVCRIPGRSWCLMLVLNKSRSPGGAARRPRRWDATGKLGLDVLLTSPSSFSCSFLNSANFWGRPCSEIGGGGRTTGGRLSGSPPLIGSVKVLSTALRALERRRRFALIFNNCLRLVQKPNGVQLFCPLAPRSEKATFSSEISLARLKKMCF